MFNHIVVTQSDQPIDKGVSPRLTARKPASGVGKHQTSAGSLCPCHVVRGEHGKRRRHQRLFRPRRSAFLNLHQKRLASVQPKPGEARPGLNAPVCAIDNA